MLLLEIVGYGIIAAVAFLFICFVSLSFWCAIDDIKVLVEEKRKRRIKHE